MADITTIKARIKTGDRSSAGTDGSIYLGIGGREFAIDSSRDDFERGSNPTYVLGEFIPGDRTINNASRNDPRVDYVLISENLDKFPAYLRFEPEDDNDAWSLESAAIQIFSHERLVATYQVLGGSNHLWLGKKYGKTVFLVKA